MIFYWGKQLLYQAYKYRIRHSFKIFSILKYRTLKVLFINEQVLDALIYCFIFFPAYHNLIFSRKYSDAPPATYENVPQVINWMISTQLINNCL